MNPITDRGPAPDFFDPPAADGSVKCDACEGTGKFGCTNYCDDPTPTQQEICREEHLCVICKGHGRLFPSDVEWKDPDEAYDARKELERGL